MAQLVSGFQYVGLIGNLSAYRIQGSDKIYVRRKGGASKQRIKTGAEFETTRRQNVEFKGRVEGYKRIARSLFPLSALADSQLSSRLNKLCGPIQKIDTESIFGQRHIQFSKSQKLLLGFAFNDKLHFDGIIGTPIQVSLHKPGTAHVVLPALVPEINFKPPVKDPYFGFVVVLAVVPDLFYSETGYMAAAPEYSHLQSAIHFSDWSLSNADTSTSEIDLVLPVIPPDSNHVIAVGVGVRFGTMSPQNVITQSRFGAARILAVI